MYQDMIKCPFLRSYQILKWDKYNLKWRVTHDILHSVIIYCKKTSQNADAVCEKSTLTASTGIKRVGSSQVLLIKYNSNTWLINDQQVWAPL